MARTSFIQTNFTAGEVAETLFGRIDFDRLANGCKRLRNAIVMPQGGVTRRPGTYYVNPTKNPTGNVRLIPFEFSTEQAYIIEVGDLYMRFYRNNGQITFGGPAYEIVTPYAAADIWELSYAQSADTMYFAAKGYAPRKLTRTGHTAWTLTTMSPQDGPFLDINTTTTTLTPSATTGAITVTASAATFAATDVGRQIRIKHGSTWGWCRITAYTSTTQVSANVGGDFAATTASSSWAIGVWGSVNGYPRTVVFYEDRLFWAGSTLYPQTLWGSKSGDYERYSPSEIDGTVNDSTGIVVTLLAKKVNAIFWLSADASAIVAGTSSGEWAIAASNNNEAITANNVRPRPQTNRGSAQTLPLQVDESILYVHRGGRKVLELSYEFNQDRYVPSDLTILSEFISKGGIREMSFQQEPHRVIWVVLLDGTLIGLTYNKEQKVVAWHKHPIGGTNATVESVATIPAPDGTYDETWFIISRDVDGSRVRYVEYMKKYFSPSTMTDLTDAYFMDSTLQYTGVAASTITGLTHLIGEEVAVLTETGAVANRTVSAAGEITLTIPRTDVKIGLPFASLLQPVSPNLQGDSGPSFGQIKRIHKAEVYFFETLGAQYGRDENQLEEILFRAPEDPTGVHPPMFSGIKSLDFNGEYDRICDFIVVQDTPYPMTVLTTVYNGVSHG